MREGVCGIDMNGNTQQSAENEGGIMAKNTTIIMNCSGRCGKKKDTTTNRIRVERQSHIQTNESGEKGNNSNNTTINRSGDAANFCCAACVY